MSLTIKQRIERRKKNDNPLRQKGEIHPLNQGNTKESMEELGDQHTLAFREAILGISSWIRTCRSLDGKEFFNEMRQMITEWEEEEIGPKTLAPVSANVGDEYGDWKGDEDRNNFAAAL